MKLTKARRALLERLAAAGERWTVMRSLPLDEMRCSRREAFDTILETRGLGYEVRIRQDRLEEVKAMLSGEPNAR